MILHPCSSHNLPNYMTRVHHCFLSYFPSSLFLSSSFPFFNTLSFIKSLVFFATSFLFTLFSLVIFKYVSVFIPILFLISTLICANLIVTPLYALFFSSNSFFLLTSFVVTSLPSHSNLIRNIVQNLIFESPWIKQMVNMTRECYCTLLK